AAAGVPQQMLQSRISDIEREIAAYQQRLVQISLTTSDAKQDGQDDRTVPSSPPVPSHPTAETEKPGPHPSDERRAADHAPEPAHEACVPAADLRSPSPSSSSDHDEAPGAAAKDRSQALVSAIYAENQRRAASMQAHVAQPFLSAYPCFIPGAYAEPADWPFWAQGERTHAKLRPHLARILAREQQHDRAHARRLQEEYRELYARWRRRVDRLDRQREARQRAERPGAGPAGAGQAGGRRRGAAAAAVAAADEFGFSLGPLFSASASAGVAGVADDVFTSDAVHSEAELAKIIERLQYDDARNPDLRSQRTAAVIPPMELGAKQRAMLQVDNNSHLISDPLTYYHARVPQDAQRVAYANNGDTDHYWTQAEVGAFVAAYLAHPKQFGRIAAAVEHKSMNACVLFYYRNKKPLRLKELEARSSKRARRAAAGQGGQGGSRRRKERTKERRERRAREARERMAEAAARQASPAETPGVAQAPVAEDDAADALDRRSKSSALLRSIIAANRRRKQGADAAETAVDTAETAEEEPVDAPAAQQRKSAEAASSEEEGELVDDDERWASKRQPAPPPPPPPQQQRRRSRHKSELNAYAMGGSIVRTRRSRDHDPPAPQPASPSSSSSSSDAEVVEASGRVADVSPATRPRVVSRKSQSRFGATLTAVIDASGAAGDGGSDAEAPLSIVPGGGRAAAGLPTESALDRFVASEPAAPGRPISSYETLRMCPAALAGDDGAAAAVEAAVEAECGREDVVLVGAAAWRRDDRRRVLRGFHRVGADFAAVAAVTPGKTPAQCRYFFHHYRTPAGRVLSDVVGAGAAAAMGRPEQAQALMLDALALPPAPAPAVAAAAAAESDDEDDETPLAAQLAEELAQQQQQQPPPPPPPPQTQPQQQPPLAQVRPEQQLPRAPSLSSLALPVHAAPSPSTATPPQPTPSPASSLLAPAAAAAPLTAKKSGYSSYWSVHERSAFLHYVVRLGQDWLALAEAIGSKTGTQVRNYFRANREKLGLDAVVAEYARRKAEGTVPPMTPYLPPVLSASAESVGASPGVVGAEGERRERRGRKRKNEGVQPSTAPASMASFPTMGVDGGRAVVVSRPPPPPPPLSLEQSPGRSAGGGSSSVLHISNLTHGGGDAAGAAEEPVAVVEQSSVRRITALLNDDMPSTPQAPVDTSEWFGSAQEAAVQEEEEEEEATGIAALALASMMGGGEGRAPLVSSVGPPRAQYHRAFSPVLPPLQSMQHAQYTRPSSVGPSVAYVHPAGVLSPGPVRPPGISPVMAGRQRKPSAPLPMARGVGGSYGKSPEAAEPGLLLPRPVMPPTAGRRVTSSVVFPAHHRTVMLPPPMQIPRDVGGMHPMPPPMQYSAGHRPLQPPARASTRISTTASTNSELATLYPR
ncbi:DNA-binding protein snt1, partial [Coemansia interrupta]